MNDPAMANHELLKENSSLKMRIKTLEQAEATREREIEVKVLERTQRLQEQVTLLTHELEEFRRVEDALRGTESQFQLFVERAPVAIGVWNLDGTGRYVNQKYLERLGLKSVEEVIGRPAYEFFAPQFREASKERTQRRLQGLPVPAEFESIALRADGTEFPVHLAIAPIQLASGTVSIAFMEDITDRKKSEEKLWASELRYKQLFEAIPESVLLIGTDGCVVAANKASARLHGFETPQQLEGFYTPLLIAEKDRARATKTLSDIVQGGERPARYYTEVRRDGSEFLAEVVSTTLRGPQQEVIGYIGITRDITAFVEANEALKASEEKYHNLFRDAPMGIFHSTFDGKFIVINPALTKLLGYDSSEEVIRCVTNIAEQIYAVPPDREKMVASAKVSGGFVTTENSYLRRDGSLWWGRLHLRIVKDQQGKPLHFEGFVGDITERRQAEEALIQSEKKYKYIFDNALDGMYRTSLDGKSLMANKALANILGYDSPEKYLRLMNDSARQVWHNPNERSVYLSLLEKQDIIQGYECQLKRLDGTPVWISLNAKIVRDEKGNVLYSEGFLTDISKRKLAEEEKEKLEAQLNQSQKMESVGRLAGGVAHDFNNMLSVIIGHAEMALDQVGPDQPFHDDLQEILKAAGRSADLTRQLLAFARQQVISPKVINLNETMIEMFKMLQRLLGEDIHLVWMPGVNLWPIHVDPSQIDQILANLCVNARDAIAGVGKLTIETENIRIDEGHCSEHSCFSPGEYVLLSVSDNGCGMDKATIDNIFEPFFTTKRVGEGTGLGLATVYGILKQNNGFITVYSEPGQGTTFKIYLPRHIGKTEQEQKEGLPEPLMCGMETVLLVEDEPTLLKLSKLMLEKQGYRVLAAGTTGEAIRLAEENAGSIHLLMTDVIMPEMNGQELAIKILSLSPNLKCLFTSGYTANVIARHGVLGEGMNFIQKPFSRNDLTAKVREILDLV